ncbi:tRNA (adenosine(37)-N6)-dimethylallyltransferase MiaA [Antarcticibacterium flavum]|uniref:tRNA dimethylallyltransferase n=1 Tax=Antarcticibacterium flavum TaxID=2058175 RepID=A0A5B7X591_9FLAO|nr:MULTISPECIES: tRNA (adenosine(37)-N6)-dimethylallyltransferase MiaA [Antarcticibacterium]MCM4161053.1 tRNA (adenosine(37)-N6)-dimethylallyltransferase MiaA [Antarcticibacterium sp. W02-3]QCY70519.1 tRNA (adenosine(37)-N6)-dimethylallyltransferase MiaA [Antarcticibacterium flavum]
MTNYLVSIVGPTAIGKTSLSIELARAFNTEILSADSRQFYREMKIGTAVPAAEELAAAPHHFIQHISIEEDYSVGDFEREALALTEELFQKNNILVLVGGSGLYVKSLLEGLNNFPDVNPEIREELNEQLTETGLQPLQRQLQLLDPDHYEVIDIENPHRVIRALEISLGTGQPYSSFLKRPKAPRDFMPIKIGLTAPREIIYERINMRVDAMMDEGLAEEAQALYNKRKLNALNTVGYKELFAFFEGRMSLEQAVEEIKKNTRRFAKRQLTWFRKEEDITWFDHTTPPQEIISFIKERTGSASE